jgi:phage protein D
VFAEDRLQDLRMTRRTRTFADQTDAALIQSIASDHGLQASVDISGPTHKVVAQVNQSDLAFVRERARRAGAELWIEGRTLNAKPRSARGSSPLKLKFGAELREFNALADLAHQRTKVNVSGWDVSGKASIKESADDAALGNELGSDKSGASILRSAFGERTESVAHMVPLTSSEAQAQAETWFRAAARRFLVGRGLAEPNGKLRVGVSVELDGVGAMFNGKYYLAEVQHRFDGASGFRSEFTAERPGLGAGQ